jgi:hypothetical protein
VRWEQGRAITNKRTDERRRKVTLIEESIELPAMQMRFILLRKHYRVRSESVSMINVFNFEGGYV